MVTLRRSWQRNCCLFAQLLSSSSPRRSRENACNLCTRCAPGVHQLCALFITWHQVDCNTNDIPALEPADTFGLVLSGQHRIYGVRRPAILSFWFLFDLANGSMCSIQKNSCHFVTCVLCLTVHSKPQSATFASKPSLNVNTKWEWRGKSTLWDGIGIQVAWLCVPVTLQKLQAKCIQQCPFRPVSSELCIWASVI